MTTPSNTGLLLVGAAVVGVALVVHHKTAKAASVNESVPGTKPTPGLPTSSEPSIAALPEPVASTVRAVLSNPKTGQQDLAELAKVLIDAGFPEAAGEVLNRIPPAATPGDVAPSSVYASNPAHVWPFIIKPGNSPAYLAQLVTGDWTRYPELIAANPSKPTNGKPFPQFNFVSLVPGERIVAPLSWNRWIAQDGTPARSKTPFPVNPAGYEGTEP